MRAAVLSLKALLLVAAGAVTDAAAMRGAANENIRLGDLPRNARASGRRTLEIRLEDTAA